MTTPNQHQASNLRTSGLLRPVAIFALLILLVVVQARAGDPVETWVGFTAKTPISKRVTAQVLLESKFRDDLDFRYQDYADLGVSIQLNDQWSIAPTIRLIRTRSTPAGPWRNIICPLPTVNWQDTVNGWTLGWRNQLDIQCREAKADMTTWRSRVLIMPPMPKGCAFRPYATNEFFFDDHSHRWSQNRAFVGTYYQLNNNWKLEAYVGYKSDRVAGHWNQTRMTGARLGLSF